MKCLEIADKNGFDWWGEEITKIEYINERTHNFCLLIYAKGDMGYIRTFHKSLADLATNKSFLEAIIKSYEGDRWDVAKLQDFLIKYLTYNEPTAEGFDKIVMEFIDE